MSNNFYDFIEIGTSDFDTLIEKAEDQTKGISIDPFQHFLDRLPSPKNCIKICAAISDERGEADIHYIKDEDIVKYNLPNFVRGSGSLFKRHPFILTLLANKAEDNPLPQALDPDEVYSKKKVPVKRLKDIIDEYSIDEIKILKIDTEGCDDKILLDYFECCEKENYPFPHFIQFEHVLLGHRRHNNLMETAKALRYSVHVQRVDNTILIRKKQGKICPTCGGKGRVHE